MTAFARTLLLAVLATVVSLIQPCRAAEVAPTAHPTRIVIQVNEGDSKKWNSVLANIRNIQHEIGPQDVAIAVVAIGPGLDMLMIDSLSANDVQDALASGVVFVACENTMHARNISRADLLDGIGFAKAGYVEIVRRQQLGWNYLRP